MCCCVEFRASSLLIPDTICMNVYMTVDSGGYVCASILCAIIATLLDASQRRQVQIVLLNRYATVKCNTVLASCRTAFPLLSRFIFTQSSSRCHRIANERHDALSDTGYD